MRASDARASVVERALRIPPGPCRIGLVSDTHAHLDPALLDHFAGCDAIVHAGDVGRADVLVGLAAVAPVVAVRGNVDGGDLADLPTEALIDVGTHRIAVRHIAGSPPRPNREVVSLVAETGADVLVVGHSHIAVAGRAMGVLWINPGAAGHEGFHSERTAGLLEVDASGEIRVSRIHLGRRGRPAGAESSARP